MKSKPAIAENLLATPRITPPLAPDFKPMALTSRRFREAAVESGKGIPVKIAIEADSGMISSYETVIFAEDDQRAASNVAMVERLVKFLLWQHGGWKVIIGGPSKVGNRIKALYSSNGAMAFDGALMADVYGRPFTVESTSIEHVPSDRRKAIPLGRHLEGCRIGFDLGASDRKTAAVIDGKEVFSEEVVWNPKAQSDPQYHFDEIMSALRNAASHMPRVDAIGGSAAGIYVNNSVRVASLFRGVPKPLFEKRICNLFLDLQREWNGVPFEVINDGEVTALAGSMSLGVNRVLGIAMGSSLAAGYVDANGNITGWLDELAFAPVDLDPNAPMDEWSGDFGCGAVYFSQVAVNRLAQKAGIALDENRSVPERLKDVQALMSKDDERARAVYETIGVCFGYNIALYADFYDVEHVLMLGRVTSGKGGEIILERARHVLKEEFPELADKIKLIVPDEKTRRVGQAIAAASLPAI